MPLLDLSADEPIPDIVILDEDGEPIPIPDEPIPNIVNVDEGISSEYDEFLKDKKLPMPSKITSTGFDIYYWIEKAMGKLKYLEEYVNVRTGNNGE